MKYNKKFSIQKSKLIKIIILLLFIIMSNTTRAETETRTIKIIGEPFYINTLSKNTEINITFNTSNIEKNRNIISTIITIEGYGGNIKNLYLKLNNQNCDNNFTAKTDYFIARFKCSNIINGLNTITLKSDTEISSITNNIEITYNNKYNGEISVYGTEYLINTDIKLWIQLLNSNKTIENNGVCYITIIAPNNEILLSNAQMENLNYEGIYYYDFSIPDTTGVYPTIAKCYYGSVENKIFIKSTTDYYIINGTAVDTTPISDLYNIDGALWKFKENAQGKLDFMLEYKNITECLNISQELMNGLNIYFYGKFDSEKGDDINFYIYNKINNTYERLQNKLFEGNSFSAVSNTIFINNISRYNYNNSILIRVNDTLIGGGADEFHIDKTYVSCTSKGLSEWVELKGSGEIHYTSINDIFNFFKDFFNNNIIFDIAYDVWNFQYRYIHGELLE